MIKKKAILKIIVATIFLFAFLPISIICKGSSDTTNIENTVVVIKDSSDIKPFTMTKSPLLAVGLSIIPGAGQIYVLINPELI